MRNVKESSSRKRKMKAKVHVVELAENVNTGDIENLRDRAIVTLLLETGLRASELLSLDYEDVTSDGKVRDSINVIGKGRKARWIPLSEAAQQAIRDIDRYNHEGLAVATRPQDPLLISRHLRRLSYQRLYQIVMACTGHSPHVLRHTALTNIRRRGTRLEVVQAIAGHADISTTARYYLAVTTDDLRQAING